MVNRNLLRQYDSEDTEAQLRSAFGNDNDLYEGGWLTEEIQTYDSNKIVNGRVLDIRGEDVLIEIGYKSEGIIKLEEWREEGGDQIVPPKVGGEV